jgi:hypothetical protein
MWFRAFGFGNVRQKIKKTDVNNSTAKYANYAKISFVWFVWFAVLLLYFFKPAIAAFISAR